jgi:hypothetical protein
VGSRHGGATSFLHGNATPEPFPGRGPDNNSSFSNQIRGTPLLLWPDPCPVVADLASVGLQRWAHAWPLRRRRFLRIEHPSGSGSEQGRQRQGPDLGPVGLRALLFWFFIRFTEAGIKSSRKGFYLPWPFVWGDCDARLGKSNMLASRKVLYSSESKWGLSHSLVFLLIKVLIYPTHIRVGLVVEGEGERRDEVEWEGRRPRSAGRMGWEWGMGE